MSLKHVVLALVESEECYGYRLHERVAELLALASPRETSRVYGVLVDLEDAGLVASRAEQSDRGRTRKLHHPTKRGEAELRRWLDRPRASGSLLRRRLLVELAVLERSAAPLAGKRRRWRLELDRRRRVRDELAAKPDESARSFASLLRERTRAHLEVEMRAIEDLLRTE
ncbi:MAG: PadR family transcriptional regulator [Deltaproteobacteria bacterium]|nr:PadR family transcriptional regulator [Deltaproteobacteria bacterium]